MNTVLKDKVRLLLVDDDADLLFLMCYKLRREGYAVDVSHNGEEIDNIISIKHPDVILMDIHMNGISGGDICRKLKENEQTKAIPIILISSNENAGEVASLCGADGYFGKPVELSLLKEKITAVTRHN
jgi:DNA-binding response OmpR family regulator